METGCGGGSKPSPSTRAQACATVRAARRAAKRRRGHEGRLAEQAGDDSGVAAARGRTGGVEQCGQAAARDP
jgi:hypothetical protein